MDFARVNQIVAHDSCPDGLASALIVREVIPDAQVRFIQYNTEDHRNLAPAPGILFVDFSPFVPSQDGALDRNVLRAWAESGSLVMDHHKTAREIVEAFGPNGVFGDESAEPGVCGAVLAWRHVYCKLASRARQNSKKGQMVERFARLAGIRDTWVKNSPDWAEACRQASVLIFMPRERWLETRLQDHLVDWDDRYGWVGLVLEERHVRSVSKALSGAYRFTTERGTRVVVFEGTHTTSDAAEVEQDADLVVGFAGFQDREGYKIVFSTRTRGQFDCARFCKSLGGGGHTKAAGFSVLEPPVRHPIEILREKLQQYEHTSPQLVLGGLD